MADRIKFHPSTGSGHRLDEHVDPDIARALRRYGMDVTTTIDAGLRTEGDPVHLDLIQREGRVVVTHDADFLRYAGRSSDHPGIVYCPMGARSIGEIIRHPPRRHPRPASSREPELPTSPANGIELTCPITRSPRKTFQGLFS